MRMNLVSTSIISSVLLRRNGTDAAACKTYCCAGVRNHGTGDEFTIVEDDTPRPPGRMCLRDAVFDILNVLALTDPPSRIRRRAGSENEGSATRLPVQRQRE